MPRRKERMYKYESKLRCFKTYLFDQSLCVNWIYLDAAAAVAAYERMPHAKPVALQSRRTGSPACNSYHREDVSLNIQFFLSKPPVLLSIEPYLRETCPSSEDSPGHTHLQASLLHLVPVGFDTALRYNNIDYRASLPVCMVTK